MQGQADIIELLNEVLTAELTAINQYFIDAKMLSNWGYERLASKFYEESISEMKDAEELIERILYLEGTPNLQRLGTVSVGETPAEKFAAGLDLERDAIVRLNRGIALCAERDDNGTRDLLNGILEGEEENADWFQTQHDLIRQLGPELYLSQQLRE